MPGSNDQTIHIIPATVPPADDASHSHQASNVETLPLYDEALQKLLKTKHWAFSGGGMKAIAFYKSIAKLKELGYQFENIELLSGISAGCLLCIALGLRYTPEEMEAMLLELNGRDFKDGNDFTNPVRIVSSFGWYSGDPIERWCETLLEKKGLSKDATFEDWQKAGFIDIEFFTLDIKNNAPKVLNVKTARKMRVATAFRKAISIPFFFSAKTGVMAPDGKFTSHASGSTYVDMGSFCNSPGPFKFMYDESGEPITDLDKLHEHQEKLGEELLIFSLMTTTEYKTPLYVTHEERANTQHLTLPKMSENLLAALAYQQMPFCCEAERQSTLVIPLPPEYQTTDFDMPLEKRKELMNLGEAAVVTKLNDIAEHHVKQKFMEKAHRAENEERIRRLVTKGVTIHPRKTRRWTFQLKFKPGTTEQEVSAEAQTLHQEEGYTVPMKMFKAKQKHQEGSASHLVLELQPKRHKHLLRHARHMVDQLKREGDVTDEEDENTPVKHYGLRV